MSDDYDYLGELAESLGIRGDPSRREIVDAVKECVAEIEKENVELKAKVAALEILVLKSQTHVEECGIHLADAGAVLKAAKTEIEQLKKAAEPRNMSEFPAWVEIPTEKNKRTRERTQLAGKRLLLGLFTGKSADIVAASGFWNETDCYWEWLGVPDTPTHYMRFPHLPATDTKAGSLTLAGLADGNARQSAKVDLGKGLPTHYVIYHEGVELTGGIDSIVLHPVDADKKAGENAALKTLVQALEPEPGEEYGPRSTVTTPTVMCTICDTISGGGYSFNAHTKECSRYRSSDDTKVGEKCRAREMPIGSIYAYGSGFYRVEPNGLHRAVFKSAGIGWGEWINYGPESPDWMNMDVILVEMPPATDKKAGE